MSAAVIGALRVNLGLDSAQFSKGLGQSNSHLMRFAAQAGKVAAGMAAGFGSAMTAMGVGAVNAAAEVERLSQVANTAPAQFQGWAAGAKSVGIEQDKLADILKDVNDRIGEFSQTGSGEMKDFFEKIAPKVGVTAEQFRNLSGADALQLYVSSLEKAGLNQQELTFYMESMADEATALIPLLGNGGKGMAAYAAKAQQMGAVMSGSMIASLREGKVAISDMGLAIDGMKNTIGAQAVPMIKILSAAVVAAATFFHQHAAIISEGLRTLAGVAVAVGVAFATRYAVAVGVTAVRATMAASAAAATYQIQLGATTTASVLLGSATRGLAVAMTLLGRAALATGIGALVVGAGILIGKFIELIGKTGGVGAAFRALGDIAGAVWIFMVEAAGAIPDGLEAVWGNVRVGFMRMTRDLQVAWGQFVAGLGVDLQGRNLAKFGPLRGMAEDMQLAGLDIQKSAYESQGAIDALAASAEASGARAGAALSGAARQLSIDTQIASMGLKDLAAPFPEMTQDAAAAGVVLGVDLPPKLDGMGKSAKAAAEKLTPLQEVMKRLREEGEKLKATAGMSETEVAVWENLREAQVSGASASGQQIAAITRTNEGLKQLKESTDSWGQSLKQTFGELVTGAISFKDALASVLQKLAEVMTSRAFDSLFGGVGGMLGNVGNWLLGGGDSLTGALRRAGLPAIGANANGTPSWRGGLTSLHERGEEIVDLPKGSRVIPAGLSRRMADGAATGRQAIGVNVQVGLDQSGNLYVREIAREEAGAMGRAVAGSIPDRIRQYQMNERKR